MFLLALLPGAEESKGPSPSWHPQLLAVIAVSRENSNQAYTDKSLSFPLENSEPQLSFYRNGEIYSGALGDKLAYIYCQSVIQLLSCPWHNPEK